jgi:energy-coupling factor transporter ATP-binding protein EcfA2
MGEVAALLPRLVADPSNRDRWSVSDLLARLGWRDPFALRHGHAFPVDALHQVNTRTQERLHQVLASVTAGYVGLVGPPGCGKSTLLAAGLLPAPRAALVRSLAFVPDEGHGLGRAEAEDFLQDVIAQLKAQGLGSDIVPGRQLTELRAQFEVLLREASERFRSAGVRTVVVVDGLDHVPREERPDHSFLRVLPQPHAVPEGVVFVLGTQRLELDGMPPEVSRQAAGDDRCVTVAPLSREAVRRLADAAGIPADVDRLELYDRAAGHPLSTRYGIEGLSQAETPAGRQDWLRNGPAFGGDVDTFYQRAWHDLDRASCARRALAYTPTNSTGLWGAKRPRTLLGGPPNISSSGTTAAHGPSSTTAFASSCGGKQGCGTAWPTKSE